MKQPARRSSLFLIELIISIFFFTIASAVCIQVFTTAHITSRQSEDLTMAVTRAESICAEITSGNENYQNVFVYYDQDWKLCEEDSAFYVAVCKTTSNESMTDISIEVVSTEDEKIYELETSIHTPYRKGGSRNE